MRPPTRNFQATSIDVITLAKYQHFASLLLSTSNLNTDVNDHLGKKSRIPSPSIFPVYFMSLNNKYGVPVRGESTFVLLNAAAFQ